MRRLYLQVYLTIVASLVLVVLTAGLLWPFFSGIGPFGQQFGVPGEVIPGPRPPPNAPAGAQNQGNARPGGGPGGGLGWFRPPHKPLAPPPRPPPPAPRRGGWVRALRGPAVSLPLPAGRRLVARVPPRHRPSALMLAAFLGAIALVVAIGARPVVRRLIGRLERLQRGVESLGAGDLTARVKVEGRDQVA